MITKEPKPLIQPNIIMFASPAFTPSNNFKMYFQSTPLTLPRHQINTKDLNSSQIHGRKVDSPQLRVLKEQPDRPQTASNSISFGGHLKRDELFSLINYQQQLSELNNTNNDVVKKQFDFRVEKAKQNNTIQHEQEMLAKSNNGGVSQNRHHKGSKSMAIAQKKRQQSSSVPRHHPSASIVNNQVQPLINLHIQNAKLASQAKAVSSLAHKKRITQHETHQQKYASANVASVQRSKSKQRHKSVQKRYSMNANTAKDTLNQSHNNTKQVKNQFLFSFDNKENQSINHNEFSPSRINGQYNNRGNMLDSDSSVSSPKMGPEAMIAQKLEKQYFMDKSSLLKHLSPDRNHSKPKVKEQNYFTGQPQVLSDRAPLKAEINSGNHKSNLSTIIPKHPLNESMVNFSAKNQSMLDKSLLKVRIRPGTGVANNKLMLKGVDKMIKENLKKVKNKEDDQISKRKIEEFKQKIKKMELSQRNHQVRKINASKIFHQKPIIEMVPQRQQMNASTLGYKKHRSKSCMNKTDSIFGGIQGPRSKERLPKQEQVMIMEQVQQQPQRKEKKREKSFFLELKELKKQIDGEIRREILAGKLDIQPTSAKNKRTNLSTINRLLKHENSYQLCQVNVNRDTSQPKQKRKDFLNMSAIDPNQQHHRQRDHSRDDLNADNSHPQLKQKRKSKSRDGGAFNKSLSQNLKKFIDRKKNAQNNLKSLEQTIEQKKHLKMKENLKSLNQYVKSHFRHQSYNFNLVKKNQNSNQQITDNEGQPLVKKLKPQFFKKKKTHKKEKQHFDFQNDNIPLEDQDVSREVYDLLHSIKKHERSKIRDKSSSLEISPKRSSSKKRRVGKQQRSEKKPQNLRDELELTANQKRNILMRDGMHDDVISVNFGDKAGFNYNDAIPKVIPEKGATLIPPQSDIATINRDNFEKSQIKPQDSAERHQRFRVSQDSAKASTKSPKQQIKVSQLMHRYGFNLPNSQMNGPSADTKLLIKLHSAAITIQQIFRKHLQRQGFYEDEESSSGENSQMYVDSEEENTNQYRFDAPTEKKAYDNVARQLIWQNSLNMMTKEVNHRRSQSPSLFLSNALKLISQGVKSIDMGFITQYAVQCLAECTDLSHEHMEFSRDTLMENGVLSQETSLSFRLIVPYWTSPVAALHSASARNQIQANKLLIAQTSPLRVKKTTTQYQQVANQVKQGNKFYADDSSDIEKVIVCSVITSARAENDESLQNTQNYIPLRQKPQKKAQQPASSTSSVQTAFNTAIKTLQPPMQQRLQEQKALQPNASDQNLSSSSQRKTLVPSLDFTRLGPAQPKQNNRLPDEESKGESSNTSRSIFERHSFRNFSQKLGGADQQFNMNNYPEMLKMREDAIGFREQEEKKMLKKMVKSKQMSPRTYDVKRKELDTWVIKEKAEVKKTKGVFEEQWTRTAQIIEQTQKNQDYMKRMLVDNNQPYASSTFHHRTHESIPSEQTQQVLLSSHRQGTLNSKRDDSTHILDKIQDYTDQSKPQARLQAQEIPQKSDRQHQLREQEKQREIERKQEIEKLKEQQRLEQERQKQLEIQQQKEQEEKAKKLKIEQEQKRQAEEKKRKEDEDLRLAQEKRKIQEAEAAAKLKKQQQEQEAKCQEDLRKAEEQRTQLEAQQKRQEEERLKRIRDEEEAEKERQRIAKEQALEKQRQEKETREKKEREKQALKEKQEKEKIEMEKKLAAVQKKFEEQNKQKQIAKVQERFDDHNLDSDDYEEDFDFSHGHDNDIVHSVLHQEPDFKKKIKEVLDSVEDQLVKDEDELRPQLSSHMHSYEENKEDEANRGLSRTRSSQYLNDNRPDEDDLNDEDNSPQYQQQQVYQQHQMLQEKKSSKNLNDESMDEDLIAKNLLDRQAKNYNSNAISQAVHSDGFFSKDFDSKDASDVISNINQISNDRTKETTIDIQAPTISPINNSTSYNDSKILVQDGELDQEDDHQDDGQNFLFLDERRNPHRLSQSMRDQIPVENEQYMSPGGLPVSPVSQNGEIRIQTGAQSLESTLTEANDLNQVLNEVNNTQSPTNDIDKQVEAITEELYRQLMAELRVELDLLLITDPRRLQAGKNNNINLAIENPNQFLSESGRFLIFERRGIKTDLFAIERYVEEVQDEVLSNSISINLPGQKAEFMDTILRPLSKNPKEMLNQLQNSEIGSYEHFEATYPPVLSLDLYLKLEKRRKQNREIENASNPTKQAASPNQDKNFLAECEHIHNKVLFDCINDSLLQFKPYGKDGAPLPWSRQNRRLKPIEEFAIEEMFEIVKHDVSYNYYNNSQLFRWAIMQAGTLPRREFVFNGVFDDELFAEIREKKLATLLAREMIETEPKWLNYEFEEAQVKIDIGDMILEQLVTETIAILKQNAGQANINTL